MTDNGVLLVGASNGVYRSHDWGASWTHSGLDDTSISRIAQTRDAIYGTTSRRDAAGVYRSDNEGLTWTRTALRKQIPELVSVDEAVYAGYRSARGLAIVARSDDAGETWQEWELSNGRVGELLVGDGSLYAATTTSVFRTHDSGATWVDIGGSLPVHEGVDELAWAGATLYCAVAEHGVYRYDESTAVWEPTALAGPEVVWLKEAGGGLYAGVDGPEFARSPRVVRSFDGGRTWVVVEIGSGTSTTDILATQVGLFITGAGVMRSDDGGGTWRDVSVGMEDVTIFALASGEGRVYAGSNYGVYASDDGVSWRRTSLHADTGVLMVDPPTVYAATWGSGLFRSDDAGSSWREINDGLPTNETDRGIYYPSTPREILQIDGRIYVDYYHGAFLRSMDGEAWETLGGPTLDDGRAYFQVGDGPLTIGEHDGALYAVAHGLTTRSFDGGDTWEDLRTAGFVRGTDLHTFDGTLYIAAEAGVY